MSASQEASSAPNPGRNSLPRALQGRAMFSPHEVSEAFGIARQTLYEWIKRPEHPFPRPLRLSPRVSRFRREDIEQWLEEAPPGGTLEDLFRD